MSPAYKFLVTKPISMIKQQLIVLDLPARITKRMLFNINIYSGN